MATPMTPAERKAAKAALRRSIRIRERELAKARTYVRDAWLERTIARLELEIGELNGKLAQLDQLRPDQTAQRAAHMLGRPASPAEVAMRERLADHAIARREASQQAREQLAQAPRCPHGDHVRLCPICNSYPIEEVPF